MTSQFPDSALKTDSSVQNVSRTERIEFFQTAEITVITWKEWLLSQGEDGDISLLLI